MKKKRRVISEIPELMERWHPTKNGALRPDQIDEKAKISVWWYLSYDDPNTGEHYDFEWMSRVDYMVACCGRCPYITGHRLYKGFNDLATRRPDVAALWHPTKNGDLHPSDVVEKSGIEVWWFFSYDDPKTGKHFDFAWKESVCNRVLHGVGCPYLSGRRLYKGFNDLATRRPDVAALWHPTKNGSLRPDQIVETSSLEVWWYLSYDDPKTGTHYDFEWKNTVKVQVKYKGCPYLVGKRVWRGYNDLESQYPEVAELWHPCKNGDLKPSQIGVGSTKKVWWYLAFDDPKTGKHFDFEWESSVCQQIKRKEPCPFLAGKMVWPGFNDLATTNPELTKQWHPTKNGNLTPSQVTECSGRKVWWYYSFDDPKTGRHFDFEWQAKIIKRKNSLECPYLCGNTLTTGVNDLRTMYPEIAAQWHPLKNGNLTPETVAAHSDRNVWWFLSYDDPKSGKHFDFEWEDSISSRTSLGHGCPYLNGRRIWIGFNDLASCFPEIATQWHPTRNGTLTPDAVTVSSQQRAWWYYPYDDPKTGKHFDFEWTDTVNNRTSFLDRRCPFLTGRMVWPGFNDLETVYPVLSREYNVSRNHGIPARKIKSCSKQKVWWTCKSCGYSWRMSVNYRVKFGGGCPKCLKNRAYN